MPSLCDLSERDPKWAITLPFTGQRNLPVAASFGGSGNPPEGSALAVRPAGSAVASEAVGVEGCSAAMRCGSRSGGVSALMMRGLTVIGVRVPTDDGPRLGSACCTGAARSLLAKLIGADGAFPAPPGIVRAMPGLILVMSA